MYLIKGSIYTIHYNVSATLRALYNDLLYSIHRKLTQLRACILSRGNIQTLPSGRSLAFCDWSAVFGDRQYLS